MDARYPIAKQNLIWSMTHDMTYVNTDSTKIPRNISRPKNDSLLALRAGFEKARARKQKNTPKTKDVSFALNAAYDTIIGDTSLII